MTKWTPEVYKVYIIISDKEIINNGVQARILIALLDEIDRVMLSYLGKNARISSSQIQRNLLDMGYEITERAIRYRLQRLESDNFILGCSAILNPNLVSEKLNRTITLRFKYSSNSSALIEYSSNPSVFTLPG